MDENKFSDKSGNFAVTNVEKYPVSFDQYLSEAPSSVKGTVLTPRVQLTRKSDPQNINRSAVIGSFWLNPPFREPVIRISTIYKAVYDNAFNYDRTHYDSFFDAYPELLMLSPQEAQNGRPNTQQLKHDVKKYSKRVAHRVFYYETGYMNYLASVLNLLAMTRYDGATPFKDIASHCRWSRINSYTGSFQRWWAPKGVIQYMSSHTAFATGVTTYGADIVALPLWTTDIFASRGSQAPSWYNLVSMTTTDKGKEITGGADNPSTVAELLRNEFRIYKQYGTAEFGDVPPNSPYIENGETMLTMATGLESHWDMFFTNRHGFGPGWKSADTPYAHQSWDNLLDSLWNSLQWWEQWLSSNFADFKDPNSDWVVFFTRDVTLLEEGKPTIELLNVIRSNKNYDVSELLSKMSYKNGNKPTTAGFVRLSLPVKFANPSTSDEDTEYTGNFSMEPNFERYDVDQLNPAVYIEDAKKWPSLTPNSIPIPDSSVTSDVGSYPVVPDALPSFGTVYADDASYAASMIGQPSVWFDQACSASLTPEDTNITAISVTADAATQYVKDGGGFVFEEDPSKVFVTNSPLFDCTDPYQCGFNIMISAQSTDSEWDEYLRDPTKFGDINIDTYASGVQPGLFPSITAVDIPHYPKCDVYPLHTSNADYVNAIGHAFVFVGQAIIGHPALANSYKQSGNMACIYNGTAFPDGAAKTKLQALFGTALSGSSVHDASPLRVVSSIVAYAGTVQPNDFDDTSITEVNGLTGSVTFADDLHDNASAALNNAVIFDAAFNPAYPDVPISIATNPIDISYQRPPTGDHFSDNVYDETYIKWRGADTSETVASIWDGNTMGSLTESSNYGPLSVLNSFIESFAYRTVKFVGSMVRPSSKTVTGRIVMAGINKWVASLMSKSTISFPGIEDLKSFWSFVHGAPIDYNDLNPSSAAMPENTIIAAPRVPNSISKDSSSYNRKANKDKRPPVNPRSEVRDHVSGKEHSRSKKSRRRSGKSEQSEEKVDYNKDGSTSFDNATTPRADFGTKASAKEFKKTAGRVNPEDTQKLI